jgi:hypothetical protein
MTEVSINLSEIYQKMVDEKTKQLEEYQAKGLSMADIVLKEQAEDFKNGFEQYRTYLDQNLGYIKQEIDYLYQTIKEGIERAIAEANANDDSEQPDIVIDPHTEEHVKFHSGYLWSIPIINTAFSAVKRIQESVQSIQTEYQELEAEYIKPK